MARRLGTDIRSIYKRRSYLERKYCREIKSAVLNHTPKKHISRVHPGRLNFDIDSGIVLVGNDAHIWPGPFTPAIKAFIKLCKELRPKFVILNGDMFDGATVSRHARIGWERQPTVKEEIEAGQEVLDAIEKAAFKARKVWTLGNHDARFETRLAASSPEYAGIHGIHLKDHFPNWEPCWSAWIGDVVVKHRFKGGIHARHNNSLWSGVTMVTGHTHQLGVTAVPDYRGIRWGVEGGCLAEPYGEQFGAYTEDNPRLWQAGFVVLTFKHGKVLMPELVRVYDASHVDFRGELIRI